MTTLIAGTRSRLMRWIEAAITHACPCSSAAMPGYAPGVSIRVTTGRPNLSARSNIRIALR